MVSFTPNPKELVYHELYFVSTSVSRKPSVVSIFAAMDEIVDAVSGEVHELFIGVPMEQPLVTEAPACGTMELLYGSQILN